MSDGNTTTQNDPRWNEISASKVGRKLYLKMPIIVVPSILTELEIHFVKHPDPILREDLQPWMELLDNEFHSAAKKGQRTLIFSLPMKRVKEDLPVLNRITEPRRRLGEFIKALRGGLEGQPHLDWIKRVRSTPEPSQPAPADNEGWKLI